jgi:predicted negative regulator of RcsB-dependent stress response
LGILTGLVIVTLIITGAYVGYHAWEASLHEEVEKHSEQINFHAFQDKSSTPSIFHIQTYLNILKIQAPILSLN